MAHSDNPDRRPTISIVVAAVALLLNGIIWPYVQMRKPGDPMTLWLTILGSVVSWALIPWAIWNNFRDAQRAASLRAQIVTIRSEYDLQLAHQQKQAKEELDRKAKLANEELVRQENQAHEELDHEQGLKEAAIRGLRDSEIDRNRLNWKVQQWESASVIYSLEANVLGLVARFEHMLAQANSTAKELLEYPLRNVLPTNDLVDDDDLNTRINIWRFQEDLRDHKSRLENWPFKWELSVLSLPSEKQAEEVLATLKAHRHTLKNYADRLLEST